MLAGVISVPESEQSKSATVTWGRLTSMVDALVVQISQAGESVPQYVLLDGGGKCCDFNQLQVRVEEKVHEHVTIGNTLNKGSNVGRAIDELLQLQDIFGSHPAGYP